MINTSPRAFLFALFASAPLAFGTVAKAEMAVAPLKTEASAAKSVAGNGSTRFDWLAKRDTIKTNAPRVSRRAMLGNGSWICSPAGFNRKSRCFKR